MEVAIEIIISHSDNESGTVCRIFCMSGLYIASIWSEITMMVAPTKNLLENGFIWKMDLSSERQFQALNHWNTTRTVKDIVSALAISTSNPAGAGRYHLKRNKTPSIIGTAIKNILCAISLSTRYFFGRSKFPRSNPFSFGSIAKATSRKPSVTKFAQIICPGKIGRG